MSWLRSLCCGRPAKDLSDERAQDGAVQAVLHSVRLSSCHSWHTSASQAAEVLRAAMGPSSHVSIFGASACSGSLVLLSCSGPAASTALLPIGQVIPSPWPVPSFGKERRQTLLWTGAPSQSPEHLADDHWASWTGLRSRLQGALLGVRPQPKSPHQHPQPQLNSKSSNPKACDQQQQDPKPCGQHLQMLLLPLELGKQLVGALLCVQASSCIAAAGPATTTSALLAPSELKEASHVHVHVYSVPDPVIAAAATTGAVAPPTVATTAAGPAPCVAASGDTLRLYNCETVERAVAGVLVDCLFAPHLRSLQEVCDAAHLLAHSPDICSLASVLSNTIAEALRSEVHLEMQVRVAVAAIPVASAPAVHDSSSCSPTAAATCAASMHYGFMLHMCPPSALAPRTAWQVQTADLQHTPAGSGPAPAAMPPPRVPVTANDGRCSRGSRCSQNRQTRQQLLQLQQQQQLQQGDGRGGSDLPSRSESFLFVTMAETARMDSALGGADDTQATSRAGATAGTGASTATAAAATACRLLSESQQRERTAWKAMPFLLSSSLFGDLIREEGPTRSCASMIHTESFCGGGAGYLHGYGHAYGKFAYGKLGSQPPSTAANSKGVNTGPPLADAAAAVVTTAAGAAQPNAAAPLPPPPSPLPLDANGRARMTAIILQDLHVYLQEVDQPGSDVFLLFGNSRRGGGSASAATTASQPACLVLLGSSGLTAAAAGVGAVGTSIRWGVSSDLGPLSPTPEDAYGGADEGVAVRGAATGVVRPSLALFITSQDRLPASLLKAACDTAQKLMEVLLPSSLESLTWGPSSLELADMSVLVETRMMQGSSFGMMAPSGFRDCGPGCAASPVASGNGASHRAGVQPRTLSNGSQPTIAPAAAVATAAAAAAATPTMTALPILQPPCLQPDRSPPLLSPRLPLRKFSSRSSMLSRMQANTPGSTGDGRDGFVPDSPSSSCGCGGGGGGGRRMPAEFVASILSPFNTQVASRSASVTASLSTINRQGSTVTGTGIMEFGGVGVIGNSLATVAATTGGGGGGRCSSPSLLTPLLRARINGTASLGGMSVLPRGPRRSVTELLDLDGLGGDIRVPELPPMDVLLASCFSTLNEVEPDLSPYASDDLRLLRLTRVIGDGGCSVVYAGRLLGLEVAVKVLEPLADGGLEAFQEAVQAEQARTAAADVAAKACAMQQQQQQQPLQQVEPEGSISPPQEQQRQQQQQGPAALWAAARQARLQDLMRGARELAVLSSISHPNIVQVYSYHTKVSVVPGTGPNELPRLMPVVSREQQSQQQQQQQERQHANFGGGGGPLRVAIVMECCDMGSLADALDSGRFKDAIMRAATAVRTDVAPIAVRQTSSNLDRTRALQSPGGGSGGGGGMVERQRAGSVTAQSSGGGLAMRAIYLTLLEVSLALRHLHARNLAHCDVKAANVLLKSSVSDPRGFTCKLGDFGLVSIVRKDSCTTTDSGMPHTSSGQQDGAVGTITHLAPEYFLPGTRLDFSVDFYAFGILMWEVFTGRPPYAEHAPRGFRDLPRLVAHEGLRPRWPPHAPPAYRALACSCWSANPAERPTAAAVVAALQRLMEA